jgi:AraC-like DNA-binding protein
VELKECDAFTETLKVTVSSAARMNIDKLIESLGGSVDSICNELNMPMEDVTGPPHAILASDVVKLLNYCAKTLGADDFGLRLSTFQDMSVLGQVWPLIQNAATVRELVKDLERYFVLFTQALYVKCEQHTDGIRLMFGVLGTHRTKDKQVIEHGLGLINREIRTLAAAPDWQSKMVQLRFSQPEKIALHHHIFGKNVYFNQDVNAIFFDNDFLSRKIVASDPNHRKIIKPFVEEDLVKQATPVLRQVEMLIRDSLPNETVTLSSIAIKMAMSERTLQRHLDTKKASFSAILDRVRKDISLNYLRQSDLSVLQISEIIGYKNLSTFSRSFKRWTGKSPRQIRVHI